MAQADGCTHHPRLAMVPSAPAVFHSDICFFPSFYGCNENPWHGSQLCRFRCGNPAFSCNNDGSPVLIQLPEEIRNDCRGERAISREINKLLTKN